MRSEPGCGVARPQDAGPFLGPVLRDGVEVGWLSSTPVPCGANYCEVTIVDGRNACSACGAHGHPESPAHSTAS